MSQAYIGEIRMLPYTFVPVGWALCDGATLSVQAQTALFAVIGNVFGGDGKTTFQLPNLIGRTPMHCGAGQGLTPRTFAATGGDATVTLGLSQIPSHTHTLSGDDIAGTLGAPAGNTYASRDQKNKRFEANPLPANMVAMGANALAPAAGQGQAHSNLQPYQAVKHFICLEGVFPARN